MADRLQFCLFHGLSRRTLLAGGLVTSLLSHIRTGHANDYLMLRVHAPRLEARFQNWWDRVNSFAQDLMASEHPNVIQFRHRLDSIPSALDLLRFVETVNNIVNASTNYVEDYRTARGPDQWATPIEFLEQGGDCEDFALTKAATLHSLGWSLDKSYLLVGLLDRPRFGSTGHAVLVAVLGDKQDSHIVLDNRSNRVVSLQRLQDFEPAYGLDRQGVIMFTKPRR